MSNVLITGGAGFIGSNYAIYHVNNYPEDHVIVLDALTYAGYRETLDILNNKKNFTFVHGNILDENLVSSLFDKYSINLVVHFAAESHVDRSIIGPDSFIKTNVEGTHTLLKIAKNKWIVNGECLGHFHHISTDEVFGTLGKEDSPFSEETKYAPNSPYAASKASSDHLVRAYSKTYGLSTTITNCSNNYGPRQFPEKLIPLCITNLLDGKNVPIYGDGLQIRDWLYVEDHIRAIDLAIQSGSVCGNWNIGGRSELSNIYVIKKICNKLDKILEKDHSLWDIYPNNPVANGKSCLDFLNYVQDRPGHDRRYAIDPTLAEKDLGFKSNVNFEQGIVDTIHWYINNESWWRPLQQRRLDFSKRAY